MECPKCKRRMSTRQGLGGKYHYCIYCRQSLAEIKYYLKKERG